MDPHTPVSGPRSAPRPVRGERLLRRTLTANALFSFASGATLLVGAPWLAPRLGPPVAALVAVGASLLPFAWRVAVAARRRALDPREVTAIVGLDVAWVIGTVAALASGRLPLSSAGVWTTIGIAEVVALFAALQTVGLARGGAGARRSRRAPT